MRKESYNKKSGQSLIEILIGIAVGVIIVGGVAATIAVTLRSNVQNKNSQTATALAQELVNSVSDFSAGNWHNLDTLNAATQYHLATTGPAFVSVAGSEAFVIDSLSFSRHFIYEEVSRDPITGNIQESGYVPANADPSTKKILVTVSWQEPGGPASVTLNKFVTRSKNFVFTQTDWSGATGQPGPITSPNNRYNAKGSNIDTTGVAGAIETITP